MNPFLMLLALLVVVPALFSPDRTVQARVPAGASPQTIVEAKLLQPLQAKDEKRPKFSRAAPPPSARRIRMLDGAPQTDAKGQAFYAFAVDQTYFFAGSDAKEVAEENWQRDSILGCVYPKSGEVIVKMGETNYPASVLWGSSAGAASAETCRGG